MTILVPNDFMIPVIRDEKKRSSAKRTIHYVDNVSDYDQGIRKSELIVQAPPPNATSLVHIRRRHDSLDTEYEEVEIIPNGGATLRFAVQRFLGKESKSGHALLLCHAALAICSLDDNYKKSLGNNIASSILNDPLSYRYLVFPFWWPNEDLVTVADSWVNIVVRDGSLSRKILGDWRLHDWIVSKTLAANACQWVVCKTCDTPDTEDLTRLLVSATVDEDGILNIESPEDDGVSNILTKRLT